MTPIASGTKVHTFPSPPTPPSLLLLCLLGSILPEIPTIVFDADSIISIAKNHEETLTRVVTTRGVIIRGVTVCDKHKLPVTA